MTNTSWRVIAVIPAFLALQLFAAPGQPRTDAPFSGQVRYVVDGDSLYLHGEKKQIRLWGINAPERNQPGYKQATRKLRSLVLNKQLNCYLQDTDKYGRSVARCENKDGEDISRSMLESGKALEYCWFSRGFYKKC